MVERQLRGRGISDERVLEAMAGVPRERFVPDGVRRRAYADGALAIGEGQTISQPYIVATMAAALELRGHERVLEVGTGSGYGAAVLSRCCREVVSVERHAALAARARITLTELGYANVAVLEGDGTSGMAEHGPYDGIQVTAAARDRPPPALLAQLGDGGVLVCPVRRGEHEHLLRIRGGVEEPLTSCRFVPLVEPPE